ncbi:MAG: immune inhibitor A, partial [Candidatus Krumholzibacteria bacterium]|nr:immune inhibitor A [Candidatus Krumholzibacteria bacterium]
MQPGFNCGGSTIIDIGVFCHEFGHAFGLPDLYDTNGGSAGVGHWGLMGSGSWNTVTQPSHMSAWAKNELGWVNLVEIDTPAMPYAVANVEFNRPVYRANITEERWRRDGGCAITGVSSMRLGLRPPEASSRNWLGGGGYGNGWDETVSHDFHYDGSGGPEMFSYDYKYDSETSYDFTYAEIDVGGTVTTLRVYHGTGTGAENIDISPYLTGPTDYKLRVRFFSDVAYSDEDGNWVSSCGAFVFDDVGLNGGGETYLGDFEVLEDGWWVDMTDPSEYFLVENRQPIGSDAAVHGGGGLAIWHIDQDVAHSAHGNTGGTSNNMPRGVALEQADGLFHLESNTNRGDAGDAYPGSTGNPLFDTPTTPSSNSYNGLLNRVMVSLAGPNGDPINITAAGGWRLPAYSNHNPPNELNDKVVYI